MAAGKKYLRCGCPACGNVLTYPDYSAGGTSVCDKCGKSVRLPAAPKAAPPAPVAAVKPAAAPPPKPGPPAPSRSEPPKKRGGFLRFVLWTLNLAVLAAVAIVFLKRGEHETPEKSPESAPLPAPATNPIPATTVVATPPPATNTNTPPPPPPPQTNIVTITNVVTVTNRPPPNTSPPAAPTNTTATNTTPIPAGTNSLAVLGLSIERPRGNKGSRLTYVTGVLQNQSDRKRFGVRIELNLLDRARNNVGMATDYTPVIEPKATWRFRALVLDARAVGASVAAIKEDQ